MKVTAIKQQLKKDDHYSIFIDGTYIFSLGADALLESRLAVGDDVDDSQLETYKNLSALDTLYGQAVRYAILRPRSNWEIQSYLQRKESPTLQAEQITNKLQRLGLVDDIKFATAFVNDRQRLHPSSRRKIILELRKKHIGDDVIQMVLDPEESHQQEHDALRAIITSKRRQSRYRDDIKLMQYLSRQGFAYGDIKAAMHADEA